MVDTPYVAEAITTHGKVSVIPQGGIFSEEFASMRNLPRTAPAILSVGGAETA